MEFFDHSDMYELLIFAHMLGDHARNFVFTHIANWIDKSFMERYWNFIDFYEDLQKGRITKAIKSQFWKHANFRIHEEDINLYISNGTKINMKVFIEKDWVFIVPQYTWQYYIVYFLKVDCAHYSEEYVEEWCLLNRDLVFDLLDIIFEQRKRIWNTYSDTVDGYLSLYHDNMISSSLIDLLMTFLYSSWSLNQYENIDIYKTIFDRIGILLDVETACLNQCFINVEHFQSPRYIAYLNRLYYIYSTLYYFTEKYGLFKYSDRFIEYHTPVYANTIIKLAILPRLRLYMFTLYNIGCTNQDSLKIPTNRYNLEWLLEKVFEVLKKFIYRDTVSRSADIKSLNLFISNLRVNFFAYEDILPKQTHLKETLSTIINDFILTYVDVEKEPILDKYPFICIFLVRTILEYNLSCSILLDTSLLHSKFNPCDTKDIIRYYVIEDKYQIFPKDYYNFGSEKMYNFTFDTILKGYQLLHLLDISCKQNKYWQIVFKKFVRSRQADVMFKTGAFKAHFLVWVISQLIEIEDFLYAIDIAEYIKNNPSSQIDMDYWDVRLTALIENAAELFQIILQKQESDKNLTFNAIENQDDVDDYNFDETYSCDENMKEEDEEEDDDDIYD